MTSAAPAGVQKDDFVCVKMGPSVKTWQPLPLFLRLVRPKLFGDCGALGVEGAWATGGEG